ncbi:MAG: RecQ family ATP-dependent DNA helicase [Candidatus Magasanikbacteria bacterium]|nr:RecQ family ATP-dependent DNA helicase [Candidatus Magasanikbacteria bacterium]
MSDLEQSLEKYFNHTSFRAGQEEIISAFLNGRDVVALLPTGGGKSLCFQLPALMNNNLTIVISPLIALMKDQVDGLRARGVGAVFINSSLGWNETQVALARVKEGNVKLLYVAPERLSNQRLRDALREVDVGFVAVDEAHCVSQWGHDFRPDYLSIKDFVASLKTRPTVGAFTATATPEVKDDIIKNLGLKDPQVFIRGFDRPNLQFFVQKDLKRRQRQEETLRIIKHLPGSGIVYAISRKETEEMANFLSANGVSSVAYHAGLEKFARTRIQNDFMENRFKVIVATIAFGMGVDKADIRFVIHAGMPSTLEGYYQEAGRAGRDGESAYCILLHAKRDFGLHNYFISQSWTEMKEQGKDYKEIERVVNIKYDRLNKMNQYVDSNQCRRKIILQYFVDPDLGQLPQNCGGCDICLNFKWENATPYKRRERLTKESGGLSDTITETVKLYQKGLRPEQIAKARSLGVTTIFTHLAAWYQNGGDFNIADFVSPEVERRIMIAINKIGNTERLGPLKDILPYNISYAQIRFVVAKVKRK